VRDVGELEPHGRQEPALGGQTTWPQHCDDAACLRGVGGRDRRVDVEAIKRSMNASEAPPAINLAVNLSVAELQEKRRLATQPTRTVQSCANRLFHRGESAPNHRRKS
jgi:hypothetical protein